MSGLQTQNMKSLLTHLKWILMPFFIFLLLINSCYAIDQDTSHYPISISFQQLILSSDSLPEKLDQKEIIIRGFLYKTQEQLILAAEPNLKSCCLTNPAVVKTKLIVIGIPFETANEISAVTLKGIFKINSQGHYALENTIIVENSINPIHLISIIIIIILIYCLYARFKKKES